MNIVTRNRVALAVFVAGLAGLFGVFAAPAPAQTSAVSVLDRTRLDPRLPALLSRDGTVDAIVTFRNTRIVRDANAAAHSAVATKRVLAARRSSLAARVTIGLLESRYRSLKAGLFGSVPGGVEVLRRFDYLPTAFVRFHSLAALEAIAAAPEVLSVAEPATYRVTAADTDQESLPLIHADQTAAAGNIGAGTYVAVLDTGADFTRPAFGSCSAPNVPSTCKIFFGKEYGTGQDLQPDDDGDLHGTNVSGIVESVAPGAKVFALDVFTQGDNGLEAKDENLVAALNDVIRWKQQGYNIRAVNMSLGWAGKYYPSTCTKDPNDQLNAMAPLFSQLRALNILPVVAAGNAATVDGSPTDGISYPACTAGAVSVGAVYDSSLGMQGFGNPPYECFDWDTMADQVTCFSQSSDKLSLLAPGAWIDAAGISLPGTSQAAPHVAGAVAVLAAARPTATASQIEAALTSTGPVVSDDRFGGRTKHRLDVAAALAALPLADTSPPVVSSVSQIMPSVITTPNTALDPSGRVTVKVSWSASDSGGSGIAGYTLYVGTNGSWTQVASPGTATSTMVNLSSSGAYQFAVLATDGAGNVGRGNGPTFTLTAYQEDSVAIAYGGSWARFSWSPAWAGYETTSTAAGSTAQMTFTGRNVVWVAPTATNRGQANVYIDGALIKTIDLYSSSTVSRVVDFSYYWPSSGPHTIKVQVVGTAGRAAVDVDGFIVMN